MLAAGLLVRLPRHTSLHFLPSPPLPCSDGLEQPMPPALLQPAPAVLHRISSKLKYLLLAPAVVARKSSTSSGCLRLLQDAAGCCRLLQDAPGCAKLLQDASAAPSRPRLLQAAPAPGCSLQHDAGAMLAAWRRGYLLKSRPALAAVRQSWGHRLLFG